MPTVAPRTRAAAPAPPAPAAAPSAAPAPAARRPAGRPAVRLSTPAARRLVPNLNEAAAAGKGAVRAETAAPVRGVQPRGLDRFAASAGSGEPLAPDVRAALEESFGVSLVSVRVHADARSRAVAEGLRARAFTYGSHVFLGPRERPDDLRLMAHEVAHVVQQQGGAPTPQRLSADRGDAHEREAERASEAALRGERFDVRGRTGRPGVQRLGISDALDYFAERAYLIPGFRMFTILLGLNPINMSRVERSAANILRALVEFIPGGNLIVQALDNYGVFDRVGAWVEGQIDTLGVTGSAIRSALDEFLDSLGWSDIFDLGDVWARARRIFTEPIDRIISFAAGLVTGVLRFIREAILRPLAGLAEGTRGYDLLKAVLGQDPITGEAVPRNAETLIGGFMRLIGQEEVWNNLRRANAVARAWAWFQGVLGGLLGYVRQIPQLFISALQQLELTDIVLLPRAFSKIAGVFGGFLGSFLGWAGEQVMSLLQIIFEVVAPRAMPYLRRAMGALRSIFTNPVGFVGNLVRAGVQGFRQFASNFLNHLRRSLIDWLTGTISGANVYIPRAFELVELIKFVLSVMGLTWQNIRQKLVRVLGEPVVATLERTFGLVVTLVREGPAAAWERIRESISNLRELVMGQIMNFVRDRVVQAAITTLLTSLNPAGAFIQAILATYNTIMFFVERIRQIARVATSFLDSIAAIASGNIGTAASRVEQTMAGMLTLVISFLARIARLGNVSDAVVRIVNRLRQPIDRALDRVVDWIVTQARRLGSLAAAGARRVAGALVNWLGLRKSFQTPDGQSHSLFIERAEEQPTLMLASTKVTFAQYLHRLSVPASDTEKVRAKRAAMDSNRALGTKLTELKRLERAAGPDPTPTQRAQFRAQQDAMAPDFDTLSDQVKILGIEGARAETVLTRIAPDSGSKLTSIEAKPLTALRGNTQGDPNANRVRGVPGWTFLEQINIARGNNNTIFNDWVRWHLIHSGLHGPAAVFNLVAAPRVTNTRFAGQVEQAVLRRVVEPGAMLYYKADIEYGNSAAPLDDFPTKLTYTWGTMKMNRSNRPVEDRRLGTQSYSGFTMPAMPGAAGPLTLKLKNVGRPFMERAVREGGLGIPQRAARRIAEAMAAHPDLGVLAAIDKYYKKSTSVTVDNRPFRDYLTNDKDEIADAQRRNRSRFTIDLSA